jgi:hypothetical protein
MQMKRTAWIRYRWCALALIPAYMAVGFAADASPKNELFPCFNWFLFSKTPAYQRVAYDLRLVRYGGKVFEPPLPLAKIPAAYLRGSSYAFGFVVRKWGKLYAKGDAKAAQLREEIEASHLGPEEAEYLLVEEKYETIPRALEGRLEEKVLQRFVKEKRP